jgi:hypothetical protein
VFYQEDISPDMPISFHHIPTSFLPLTLNIGMFCGEKRTTSHFAGHERSEGNTKKHRGKRIKTIRDHKLNVPLKVSDFTENHYLNLINVKQYPVLFR